MDIHNLKCCISHEEATIRSFIRDPQYADYYLQSVIADGDKDEIAEVQAWYNEAKTRTQETSYWNALLEHAQKTAQNGYNIEAVLHVLNEAIGIIKATVPAGA